MAAEPAPLPDRPMTADAFLAWSLDRTDGRYELERGRVVAMASERVEHAEAKIGVAASFFMAVRAVGLKCQVFTDGMAVRIDDGTVYEPDASIRCGARLARGTVEFSDPVVVVEVVSPSSKSIDSTAKLLGYFRLPSVRHYLIVDTAHRVVIHHMRREDGIVTRILHDGDLELDPPGLTVTVADLLPPRTDEDAEV